MNFQVIRLTLELVPFSRLFLDDRAVFCDALLQCLPDLTKGNVPGHYPGGAERRGDQFHLAIKFGFENNSSLWMSQNG
jgi:hypothetical protein